MIQKISNIQELYQLTGFDHSPITDHFDIITHQETYPSTRKMVPAHRRDFFSIIFLENQQEGEMQINQDKHANQEDIIFFQGPQHVFSFVRGESMTGFLIFFKPEFLLPLKNDVVSDFSFFRSSENNLFHLNSTDKKEFVNLFKMIKSESRNQEVVKALLLALLEKAALLQKKHQTIEKAIPGEIQLVNNFKRLVNNHFIEEKSVEFYAIQLNLTANYLNNRIKAQTGKTAKEHISERILLEAKNMLLYTDFDIAEISFRLNFSEPTYFGKFFKKHTQITPRAFRSNR
ncbi:helix-turn-helix domain-containing protein [Marinifilum caeruleilacunae]|uniref:AraC family transcriptional regulator n=1 Tax=Marinifilum caeruleilacunae TaxID=2499076 RepID=A0ABX1WQD3_9BACT|nr:helix-turn-helix domain-containing protein [Marinifilum caeruleilacunae]NOU58292.1 AraC family transcriptional regulator [Marinifilum caeruleilacunae]